MLSSNFNKVLTLKRKNPPERSPLLKAVIVLKDEEGNNREDRFVSCLALMVNYKINFSNFSDAESICYNV